MIPDRVLPHNQDAERAVLGAIFVDPVRAGAEALSRLTPEHFYHEPHAKIFSELGEMQDAGVPVDLMTLTTRLADKGLLSDAGGPVYLTDLAIAVPTVANLGQYIDAVCREYLRRQVVAAAVKAWTTAFDDSEIADWLPGVQQSFLDIGGTNGATDSVPISKLVKDTLTRIDLWYQTPGAVVGLATGFRDIDRLIGGMRPGNMVVIAGRPGHGKSSLAMNLVENAALAGHGAGVFSLEMTAPELSDRLVTGCAGVALRSLQAGYGKPEDFLALMTAAARLVKTNVHIDDSAALSIAQIRARARRMRRQHDIELIVIDYLQLSRGTHRHAKREEEVSEVSQGVKAMAKELQVPVVAVCQLNRLADGEDRTPRLSWLRESGQIEQDADVVGFLVRPELFARDQTERTELKGQAILTIAKQRNGPTGDVTLTFIDRFTRFVDAAKIDNTDEPPGYEERER